MMWKTATTTALATFAGLALTQTALGANGEMTPIQPVSGNSEAVSPGETDDSSLIIFSLDAVGVNVAAAYTTSGVFQIQFLNNDNTNFGTPIDVPLADLSEFLDAGTPGTAETGDLVQVNVGPTVQTFGGPAFGINIIFNDGDATPDCFTQNNDGFPMGGGDDTDTLDMSFELNKVPSVLSQVLSTTDMNGDIDCLFLVGQFNPLAPDGAAANNFSGAPNAGVVNPNITTAGGLSVADFEFDTSGDGTFMNMTANEFGSADVLANNQTFIKINIGDPTMSDLSNGDVVRVAAGGDVRDLTGSFTGGEIAIMALTPLSIDSASWTLAVGQGATVPASLQVSMNLAISAAGDATFWNGLVRSSGTMTDLSVTAAAIDGADNTKINLTVASGGTDEIEADGLEGDGTAMDHGDTFDIEVDAMTGTPPDDIFGNTFTGTADVDVTDGIAPTRSGALAGLDMDADGQLDAFLMEFDEPMDVSGGDMNGFTLIKLGATVHPYSLFMTNLATGEFDPTVVENEATIDIAGDATDEFQDSITSFGTDSDDTLNRLTTSNLVYVVFDPALASFQTADMTPLDATPGTFDVNWATAEFDAAMSGLADANGNAPGADLAATNISQEEASPLLSLVNFNSADNEVGGSQRITEQDGVAGDDPNNNVGRFLFNEPLDAGATAGNIDETRFRSGNEASDLFANGDFVAVNGAGANIVELTDSAASGFFPGDTASILSNSGVEDANGNEFGSTTVGQTVAGATAPFIPLQLDVNGGTILSAFLIDQDADGFADIIRMFFTKDLANMVDDADFTVAGVTLGAGSVVASTNSITITLPTLAISASSPVNVIYNGATAMEAIADSAGNSVDTVNTLFSVEAIPSPNADGEFTAVMNIAGTITGPNGNPAQAGTKVFGFIAVPVIKSASGTTKTGIAFTNDDDSSLEAWTNWLLGIDTTLYLYDDQGDMYFQNFKENDSQDSLQFVTAKFNSNGSTWTAKGETTPNGGDSQPAAVSTTNGSTTTGWDVLRSDDGTASSLMSDGFDIGGQPIASSAVLLDDNGGFLLHMTAPESIFNGSERLNAEGWPVIIVVELTTGERFIVSSLTNGADNQGPILFGASQLDQDSNGGALGDLPFDIDLSTNVGTNMAYPGWNLMGVGRDTGFADSSGDVPDILPRGVNEDSVVLGSDIDLDNVFALNQFPWFVDSNGDGDWTSADDGDPFDGIQVDINCFDFVAFVMTSDGVQVANPDAPEGIEAFTGGYAYGLFNGSGSAWGMFMFGPSRGAGNMFVSSDVEDLNNNATLGWILNTSSSAEDAASFLSNNQADFNIEFNRTSAGMVDITTAATGGGDQDSVNSGQAYVTHYPEQ